MRPTASVSRALSGLLAVIALLSLIAAACTDALPDAPPEALPDAPLVAEQEQAAASEPNCGWLRWTDARVSLVDWFAANPQTAALHRWNAVAGEFQTARRGEPASARFDALTRGMLVWQEREGDGPPRMFSTAEASGVMRLQPGFNLAPWLAGDGETSLYRALRWIGPNVASLASVGAATPPCMIAISNYLSPLSWWEADSAPAEGDLIAIELREESFWSQPWASPPQLLTGADVSAADQAELWREWETVAGYMTARHGAAARLEVVTLQTSFEAVLRSFELLLDREFNPALLPVDACGAEIEGWLGLTVDCDEPIAFDHEYVHALQYQAVSGGRGSVNEIRPLWLVEGMAMYLAARYRDAEGHETYHDSRAWALDATQVLRRALPLARMESYGQWRAVPAEYAYAIAMLAAEWLAAQVGDDALFAYMRQLQRYSDRWEIAFEIAFGLTLEQFYERFEAHMQTYERPLPQRIAGRLVDPEGAAQAGLRVFATPWQGGASESAPTDAEGRFEIAVAAGRYALEVGGESLCVYYGYHREGAALGDRLAATPVEAVKAGEGGGDELVVRLPAPLPQLRGWSVCGAPEGGGWLRGRVLDSDGRGVPNVSVQVCSATPAAECANNVTDAEGVYAVDAPPGDYLLVVGPADNPCVVWGIRGAQGQLVLPPDAAVVAIGESRISGVDIHLPAPAEQLEARDLCP